MSNIFERAVEHTKETWADVLNGDATTAQYLEAGAEVIAVAAMARLGLSRCATAMRNAASCGDEVVGLPRSSSDLLRNAIQSGDEALVAALRDGEESLKIFCKKAKIIDAQPNGYGGYFLHCDDGALILSGPYKSSYNLKDLAKISRDYAQQHPTTQLAQDDLLKSGSPVSEWVRGIMRKF